jgi:hypothetical protein
MLGGMSTALITWITPFEAKTFGVITFAPFAKTEPLFQA